MTFQKRKRKESSEKYIKTRSDSKNAINSSTQEMPSRNDYRVVKSSHTCNKSCSMAPTGFVNACSVNQENDPIKNLLRRVEKLEEN